MDDVTFGRNGHDTERWRLTRAATAMNDVTIVGRSLMPMNACFLACSFSKTSWATSKNLTLLLRLDHAQWWHASGIVSWSHDIYFND